MEPVFPDVLDETNSAFYIATTSSVGDESCLLLVDNKMSGNVHAVAGEKESKFERSKTYQNNYIHTCSECHESGFIV